MRLEVTLIRFVKAGGSANSSTRSQFDPSHNEELEEATDSRKRSSSQDSCRPDKLLLSKTTNQPVLLELKVPWEERMEEAHEKKRTKYQPLMEDFQQQGRKT